MELLAILLLCFLLVTWIMPWVNHWRLLGRRRDAEQMQQELDRLNRRVLEMESRRPEVEPKASAVAEVEDVVVAVPPPIPRRVASESVVVDEGLKAGYAFFEKQVDKGESSDRQQEAVVDDTDDAMATSQRESRDWFGKLAVWVGGVALLMAGFYMVKFSIDSGWLTPSVRLWLTTVFGVLLCAIGFVMGLKATSLGNLRIGQALCGAGVACLYFSVYAAVNLYAFLAPSSGFCGMVVVTGLAVVLSLRHGAPIALMGLVGGFLTPMLMGNFDENTASLFVYLFLLFGAAQFLCVKRGWWALFFGSLLATYLWSGSLLLGYATGAVGSPEGAMLFILGVCALNASLSLFLSEAAGDGRVRGLLLSIRLLAWAGGLVQALVLVWLGGFQGVDMALFSVLSLGALTLAVLREDECAWAGWLGFGCVLVGALTNSALGWLQYFAWPTGVALVFFAVCHFKALRSERRELWQGLSLSALILTLLVFYVNREWVFESMALIGSLWLWLSLVVAALILLAAEHLKRFAGAAESTVGEYSAFAFFVVGCGVWDFAANQFLALALIGLLLLVAIYWRVRQLARPGLVLGVLMLAWVVSMQLRIWVAGDALFGLREIGHLSVDWIDLASWYLGAGVFGLVLCGFGSRFRSQVRTLVVWGLGVVGMLAIVASYRYLDEVWLSEHWTVLTIQGGLTSLLAMLGVSALVVAKRWPKMVGGCWLLSGVVAYRIVLLHLFARGAAGSEFFWNALLWQFGLPFLAVYGMAWICRVRGLADSCRVYQITAMLLAFVWATFLVQDYSGSPRLFSSIGSSTEMYTYSVVWLVLAVIYQAIGLWRGVKVLHVGSLILLLLTVGKVFVVDASELQGLYRVLSFLGLGLALIGIGFFYNKVVFGRLRPVEGDIKID